MTEAPKIDTQAPERIWAHGRCMGRMGQPLKHFAAFYQGAWETREGDANHASEYILASLSAAREAAAALAMREAAKKIAAAAGLELKNEHGRDEGVSWGYVTMARIDALPIPADASAALDGLIAERVREAVEAANIADDPKMWGLSCDEIAQAIRARGCKEGQS